MFAAPRFPPLVITSGGASLTHHMRASVPRFRDASIQTKLVLMMVATAAVALLLGSSSFFLYDVLTFRQRLSEDLAALADTLQQNVAESLIYNDRTTAVSVLQSLRPRRHIVRAWIDKPGGEFAAIGPPRNAALFRRAGLWFLPRRIVVVRPIQFNGREIGVIGLESDTEEVAHRTRQYGGLVLVVFSVTSFLAILIARYLQRIVSTPLSALLEVARSISNQRDYSARVPITRSDEMGILVA